MKRLKNILLILLLTSTILVGGQRDAAADTASAAGSIAAVVTGAITLACLGATETIVSCWQDAAGAIFQSTMTTIQNTLVTLKAELGMKNAQMLAAATANASKAERSNEIAVDDMNKTAEPGNCSSAVAGSAAMMAGTGGRAPSSPPSRPRAHFTKWGGTRMHYDGNFTNRDTASTTDVAASFLGDAVDGAVNEFYPDDPLHDTGDSLNVKILGDSQKDYGANSINCPMVNGHPDASCHNGTMGPNADVDPQAIFAYDTFRDDPNNGPLKEKHHVNIALDFCHNVIMPTVPQAITSPKESLDTAIAKLRAKAGNARQVLAFDVCAGLVAERVGATFDLSRQEYKWVREAFAQYNPDVSPTANSNGQASLSDFEFQKIMNSQIWTTGTFPEINNGDVGPMLVSMEAMSLQLQTRMMMMQEKLTLLRAASLAADVESKRGR